MKQILVLLVFLGASCKGGNGDDTGSPANTPDVAGRYNVQVRWTSGCEGDPSWIEDWATGPLLVSGSGDTVTFDFYDEMTFEGSVSADHTYRFSGAATWSGAALLVSHSGSFELQDDRWVLSGEFAVEVDDDEFETNNCTIDGGVEAYELQGSE